MRTKLIRLRQFSGPKASVYSMLRENGVGMEPTLIFDRFIDRHKNDFFSELTDIARRLRSLGQITGCTENFFRQDEGREAYDLVCALYDLPNALLRLYCIRLSDRIVIIGDGGRKTTRAWQDDPQLTRTVGDMMYVSKITRAKLKIGDLRVSASGLLLEGDLYISRT